ncbi:Endopolyphosphatase [Mytilinidion resinicola]|uniref:Endopolyphosphatase n=1 Tax=Mytilinidion resinicola TaxID=574789 RepID=A0A6A6YZB9_9PEZI|nr:Endopolyphosphatase [Mytilinidion resinicola]KAF2813275.1 Endopolyphosphatase [Mytilinidion resinicola]
MRFLVLALSVGLSRAALVPRDGAAAGTQPDAAGLRERPRSTGRKLTGRFLHVTDFHPDPYYKTYSSTEKEAACHRSKGPAGVYGAETSACDSPTSLVNETFRWIEENLKGSIDFVIWTGDSARHDNDEQIPRNTDQVVSQNEMLVDKFKEVFGKDDNINDTDPTNDFTIPIVPTFGNNDILPHNIFDEGPNRWTGKYLDIWRNFIPEEQRHQFQRGGWFYVEVIPGKLAVISLNTLYFFDSNSVVDGCASKKEPGYEHMEWLRIQLRLLRERGMKAILIGHVPPARTDNKLSWDETCWQKYTLNMRQYRDVVVGALYGHMNIDHFMLQDFKDITKDAKKGRMKLADVDTLKASVAVDGEVGVQSASDYLIDLRDTWAKLPSPPKARLLEEFTDEEEHEGIWDRVSDLFRSQKKKKKKGGKGHKPTFLDKIGGPWGERFSVSHVSASVVPNYFPTLRVFEYNITGLESLVIEDSAPISISPNQEQTPIHDDDFFFIDDDAGWTDSLKQKKKQKASKKPKKHKFKVPSPPSKSAPPGPAYSPQTFTFTGYKQYFANLTHINNDFVGKDVSPANRDFSDAMFDDEGVEVQGKWREGKHGGKKSKKNKPKPKKFKFEVEYDTKNDKVFKLKDLTVRSYVDLARRIGEAKGKSSGAGFEAEAGEEVDAEEKGKKGKKHKKKHGKHKKRSVWFAFVNRAFVGTMDPDSIEEMFEASEVEGVAEIEGEEMVQEL